MRKAQVRFEHAAVYVQAPYSALIPDALVAKNSRHQKATRLKPM